MSREACVVAVDVGTSAVRAALVDQHGCVVRLIRQVRTSTVGGEYFDADDLWADVEQALRKLNTEGESVAGLAVSAHIGTVAVDESMASVLPAGGWADTRGVALLEDCKRDNLDSLLKSSGRPVATGGALAVALELKALSLDHRVATLLSPKDFIILKLTGVSVADTINAAYTLASDISRKDWQWDTLERLSIPGSWFPSQMDPFALVAEVQEDTAADCLLPEGTPVVCGGPDGSIGIGLLLSGAQGTIADVAGTTDVLGCLVDGGESAPVDAVVNPALQRGRWVAGGPTGLTGGAVANWRSLVGSAEETELSSVVPGSDGLRVIPTMSGERFPRWSPATRGAVFGHTASLGGPTLLRAAQEGAAFTVREGLDALDSSRQKQVTLAGGSARSLSVAQLRADLFGRTVRVASNPDVTLLGAAGLAFVATGHAATLAEVHDKFGIAYAEFDPDELAAAAYDGIFDDWKYSRDLSSNYDLAMCGDQN